MLISESAEQRPRLIQTVEYWVRWMVTQGLGRIDSRENDLPAMGGKRMARMPRNRSPQDMMTMKWEFAVMRRGEL